jgi:hypothetical protein
VKDSENQHNKSARRRKRNLQNPFSNIVWRSLLSDAFSLNRDIHATHMYLSVQRIPRKHLCVVLIKWLLPNQRQSMSVRQGSLWVPQNDCVVCGNSPISAALSLARLFRSAICCPNAFTNSEALRRFHLTCLSETKCIVSDKMSVCVVIRAVIVHATNRSPVGANSLAFTTSSSAQVRKPLKWEERAEETR